MSPGPKSPKMLNVLFFIEPSFELEQPQFKGNLLTQRVVPVAATLRAAYGRHVCMKTFVNDAIAKNSNNTDFDLVVVKQSDLYDLLLEDPLQYRIGFFAGSLPHSLQHSYAQKIGSKLNGFIPDVIFAFNNANFLKTIYPNALILHSELGYFNRPPFPESWFFDPIGAGGSAWLNRYWSLAVAHWNPSAIELETSEAIIEAYRDNIKNFNPIINIINQHKSNYKSMNLLTLQFSNQPFFDGYLKIRSQLQLAMAVLEKTPPDDGLIITEHPIGSLNNESRAYLLEHYPQYVPLSEEAARGGTSQFFVPHCKTLVTPASTVAALKLFWGNGLINLTDRYLPQIADGHSLNGVWPSQSSHSKAQRNYIYSWMVHRFLNTKTQRQNPEWLKHFIEVGMHMQETENFLDYYNQTQFSTAEDRAQIWLDTIGETARSAEQSHVINSFSNAIHRNNRAVIDQYFDAALSISNSMAESDEHMMLYLDIAQYHHVHSSQQNLAVQYSRMAADVAIRLMELEKSEHRISHYWRAVFNIAYFSQIIGDLEIVRAAVNEMIKSEALYGSLSAYFKDRIANELKF